MCGKAQECCCRSSVKISNHLGHGSDVVYAQLQRRHTSPMSRRLTTCGTAFGAVLSMASVLAAAMRCLPSWRTGVSSWCATSRPRPRRLVRRMRPYSAGIKARCLFVHAYTHTGVQNNAAAKAMFSGWCVCAYVCVSSAHRLRWALTVADALMPVAGEAGAPQEVLVATAAEAPWVLLGRLALGLVARVTSSWLPRAPPARMFNNYQ